MGSGSNNGQTIVSRHQRVKRDSIKEEGKRGGFLLSVVAITSAQTYPNYLAFLPHLEPFPCNRDSHTSFL